MPLEYDDIKLQYFTPYVNKHYPDVIYDDEADELVVVDSSLNYFFMDRYDEIIESISPFFTKQEYDKNETLQQTLQKLKLNPEAFWGFLVFIFYMYKKYFNRDESKNPWVSVDKEMRRLGELMYDESKKDVKSDTKITILAGRKKVEITNKLNKLLLNEIARTLLSENGERTRQSGRLIRQCSFKTSERAMSYCILKTISEELITDHPEDTKLTNNEKMLYLCLLNLCKFNYGDICTKGNYIIIRRLFSDYKSFDIHISSMESMNTMGSIV